MEMQVISRNVVTKFVSNFSDAEAAKIISEMRGNEFAASLYRSYSMCRMSPNQTAWMHKLAVDSTKEKPKPIQLKVNNAVKSMFEFAGKNLKFPKITFQIGDEEVILRLGGDKSKYKDLIVVHSPGGYGRNKWFGHISAEGQWMPGHHSNEEISKFVVAFAADPVKIAKAYGKNSGRCCFCHRELTDIFSLDNGYGKKCAENYGMPY